MEGDSWARRGRGALPWAVVAAALAFGGCFVDRSGSRPADGSVPPAPDADVDTDGGVQPDDDAGVEREPPGPPSAPVFRDVSEQTARVAWNAPTTGGPVDSYELHRAPDASGSPGPYSIIGTGLLAPPFDDAGLIAGTSYWYRVRAFNEAGFGDYSPASMLTTPAEIIVTRAQYDDDDGSTNPTASFGETPVEGSLLVAIAFHRLDEAAPSIAGWTERASTYYRTGLDDRRGLTVFTKVAGPAEPTDVQVVWTPGRQGRLLVQELRSNGSLTWTFEGSAAVNSGHDEVTSLTVDVAADVPAGQLLSIGAFGSRDDPESDVAFSGLGDGITVRGARSIGTAYAVASGAGPQSSTASWSRARRASAALIVFRVER